MKNAKEALEVIELAYQCADISLVETMKVIQNDAYNAGNLDGIKQGKLDAAEIVTNCEPKCFENAMSIRMRIRQTILASIQPTVNLQYMKPKFVEFPKMARLSRECVITEKIDGTNASITITEDGQFLTGSRTRWITPEEDNAGFSLWAQEHKEELFTLGVGTHFGEWWGKGIQRNYGINEKRFSLFNVLRWCLYGTTPQPIKTGDPRNVKMQQILPPCCGLVPELYRGEFTTFACETAIKYLECFGSKAVRGFMKPEGIVCFHIAAGIGFKKTIEKDDKPKSL
jgi:hypothetical protein